MNNLNLKTKIVRRSSLFFGRFPYCIKGTLKEMNCLRTLDHDYLDKILRRRREWGRRMVRSSQPGTWHWDTLSISDIDVDNLHRMCDFLLADNRPRKLTISGERFYIYTTDLDLVKSLTDLKFLDKNQMEITSVDLISTAQPGVKVLKKSQHTWRTYLRSIVLTDQQRDSVVSFLLAQQHIKLSPSLALWCERSSWARTFDYYFFDYNEPALVTMLSLIHPKLVRKSLPIEVAK